MKYLNKFLIVAALALGINNVEAQDENNPWQLQLGVNAIDVYPTADVSSFGNEFFNAEDHWNVIPTLSALSVSKYLDHGLALGARGTVNKITRLGDVDNAGLSHYALDGTIKYDIINTKQTVVDPFVEVGGGYTWVEGIGAGTANAGVGVNFWFTESLGLTLQSSYKHAFEDYGVKHFQHLAGLSFRFGGTDTDGDKVYDKDDACPEVAGLKEFNGCPDSDGDGIEDSKDNCPNAAGSVEMNGCPDADGDGIADKDDACPAVAGDANLGGCPDADGDGVADKDDACPDVAGPAENKGCAWSDSDSDGVLDKDDSCPKVVGTVANGGCPELTEEVQKKLNDYAKTILFDTGKASIKAESTAIMVDIINILKEYPTAKFTVEGHTDSIGSDKLNQSLSEKRAIQVKTFLVEQGIEEFKLSAIGYGEAKPVATNKTKTGRKQNRRVEINLIK